MNYPTKPKLTNKTSYTRFRPACGFVTALLPPTTRVREGAATVLAVVERADGETAVLFSVADREVAGAVAPFVVAERTAGFFTVAVERVVARETLLADSLTSLLPFLATLAVVFSAFGLPTNLRLRFAAVFFLASLFLIICSSIRAEVAVAASVSPIPS